MKSDCYKLNPLQRGGTSQDGRSLKALLSTYILIDERQIEDLIGFTESYGTLLAYYNTQNQVEGDWQPFIISDLSTILANVSKRNYKNISETFEQYLQYLTAELTANRYKPLFNILFSLFWEIERMNHPTLFNTPFKQDLNNEIAGRLNSDFKQLIASYKAGVSGELVSRAPVSASTQDAFQFQDVAWVLNQSFSRVWIVKTNETDVINSWTDYHTTYISADDRIYGDPGWDKSRQIDFSLASIKGMFNRAYAAYVRLIHRAENHLRHSLEQYSQHSPYNVLLLTFFPLFAYAQDDLKQLTDSHLRFYFEQVLRLKTKPAVPDSVHLLLELAKNKEIHRIPSGTVLKAGKDKTGKDLIYTVDSELVVNTAQIDSLKTIFIDTNDTMVGVFDNSKDGLGTKLEPDNPQWQPFGQLQSGLSIPTMQRSEIGLAIAAPILRLKAGKRVITLKFFLKADATLNSITSEDLLKNNLQVQLSGEKQWIPCSELSKDKLLSAKIIRSGDSSVLKRIEIEITLNQGVDPIVDYNPSNLKGGFTTPYPIAQIRIKKTAFRNVYELLRQLQIERIEITTIVTELQDLVLQNDLGVLDASQPFQPFGPRPKVGSTFYIGTHEALSKKLTSLNFTIQWQGVPSTSFLQHYSYKGGTPSPYVTVKDNSNFKVEAAILQKGSWSPSDDAPLPLFKSGKGKVSSESELKISSSLPDANPELPTFNSYSLEFKGGFLRLILSNPPEAFGHDQYPKHYTQQVIKLSRGSKTDELPNEPYTPTIQSITCNYRATAEIQFGSNGNATAEQFFHLLPFGYRTVTETAPFLVPQFVHQTATSKAKAIQGALYIGIVAIKPQQTLSILFQVAEGTEDPIVDPPHVVWSYLSQNEWKLLDKDSDKNVLADSTNGLLDSGIIRFRIPADANDTNTLMPKGKYWLRASIAEESDKDYRAIPQLIGIHAQAIRATFSNRNNDPYHLATPLPAGSISKLFKPNAAIKVLSQPYASFNGRMEEDSPVFANRVSERLRHKNRAITLWDYERLVLEEFPFLYKVKCLNHTNEDTELAPGSVRVVVVPNMRNLKAGNLFQPKVSNGIRSKIKKFLCKLNSDFVDLKVENPRYEAIEVNCKVQFFQERYDKLFYQNQLKEDIKQFLAPWAFDASKGVDFGGSLHQSVILNFVENLPYVDYVTDFILDVYFDDGSPPRNQVSEVVAATSRSILTSYQDHNINLIPSAS